MCWTFLNHKMKLIKLFTAVLSQACQQNQMWRHCPLSGALHGIAHRDKVTANVDTNNLLAHKLARPGLQFIQTNLTVGSSSN